MTVQLNLSEDKLVKLCEHLEMSEKQYRLMYQDARKAGDKMAFYDFRAEAEIAKDIRAEIKEQMPEVGPDGQ